MIRISRSLVGLLTALLVAVAGMMNAAVPVGAIICCVGPPPPSPPYITSLSPDAISVRAAATSITITGSGFTGATTVRFTPHTGAAVTLTPTIPADTTAKVTLPRGKFTTPTTVDVTITTPVGASNPVPLFVLNANATVTNMATASVPAGSGNGVITAFTTDANGNYSLGMPNSLAATAFNGTGAVTVAQYKGNPAGGLSFGSGYFDVNLTPGSTFTSVQMTECLSAQSIKWYNPTTKRWLPVTNQQVGTPPGCVTMTFNATTSPTLAQLTGTYFSAGTIDDAYIKSVIAQYVKDPQKADALFQEIKELQAMDNPAEKAAIERRLINAINAEVGESLTADQAATLVQLVGLL